VAHRSTAEAIDDKQGPAPNPMTHLSDFPATSFENSGPDISNADSLRWQLEEALLPVVAGQGAAGLADAIAALNQYGHELRLTEQRGMLHEYSEVLNDGGRRLRISGYISDDLTAVSVSFESLEAPALTDEERRAEELRARFYKKFMTLGRHGVERYPTLSEADRVIYCVGLLEAEVNNGGFSQYVWNTEGVLAHETLNVLFAIDATDVASLLEKAMNLFPEPAGRDRKAWLAQLEAMDAKHGRQLNRLDDRFYDTDDDLSVLAMEFLRDVTD
jgi:hypothetical protein